MTKPNTQNDGLCLVLGASGYIGSHLVQRLMDEGIPVRASSRDIQVLESRDWINTELVAADALVPASLDRALAGVEIAYYLVHSMNAGKHFGQLDVQAASNFARAAVKAGVRRIVYLGGLVPDDADSEHIISRRQTGEQLRSSHVPVIEVRAGIVVGAGSAAFEVMRDLVYHLPLMLTPRWVQAKSPPIALDNLLTYLVHLPHLDDVEGCVFEAGGPDTLTYADMMRILAEVGGRPAPWIIPLPVLTPKLSSYWLRLITAVPTNIARALIGGLKHDFVADDAELRRRVPQYLLGFREAVEAAFAAERSSSGVIARWTEGAFAVRNQRIDFAYYAKHLAQSVESRATAATVWSIVTAFGGDNGYYYMNSLWRLRELLNGLTIRSGRSKGRRHATELRIGDRIDSWKVLGIEPERRLSLSFGMQAPGAGMLEFELEPLSSGGTRLSMTAHWHPAGVWGLLYWYSLVPLHKRIFKGTVREICRRAEYMKSEVAADNR
ncbi:MAG: SDR family oxidoreductase [Gammaproteobacteria bacterium]|nr:SDR family oxidoreductase [Gammaproteobacteria bacterium]